MTKPLTFQQVILKLHQFWSDYDCVIWEPYNIQNGAGTNNPATLLRVLGPEPWRVAYVEPSIRPDDGRYGENPNRMQRFYQYQVILKPDPGNPQELYLASLKAIGIDPREHDIRFVEDNWQSPVLGAWGLGWEVWLDGQEITQFTYFQQAGGITLDPVSVEITYGIERIVLALQGKDAVWDVEWLDGGLSYGDLMLQDEIEHCRYYYEIADIQSLQKTYDIYEQEHQRALAEGALIPSYDYILKCSHLFNVLDARGAVGVTERATFFRRMRDMSRNLSKAYAQQREDLGHPLKRYAKRWASSEANVRALESVSFESPLDSPADVLLEIGVEEMPAIDVDEAITQLDMTAETLFNDLRLEYEMVRVYGTPRRLVLYAKNVAPRQADIESVIKGPPANRAFDDNGNPTKAAEGFARSRGLDVSDLRVEMIDGGEYVVATVKDEGRYTGELLIEALPNLIANIKFGKSMRWNSSNLAFSRPIRWIVAMHDDTVIPFEYAGIYSGNLTYGLRPYDSPRRLLAEPLDYFDTMRKQNIDLNREERREAILKQVTQLANEVNGHVPDDPGLLAEVTNLVEAPTAFRGTFHSKHLELPRDVLVTVMRKHQRYFPVEDSDGRLMPYFIAVRNGDNKHLDKVIHGNEHVLRARFADADFFYKEDRKKQLKDHLQRLSTLTFEETLGSMLDKNERVAGLVAGIGELVGVNATEIAIAEHAAHIGKADLATQMVVELTSLQGAMGRDYALKEGYPPEVADAIFEQWLPRGADDILPESIPGTILGLTDRLDSLVGLFAAGHAPRSTADPYGLRRAALGIIQLLIHKTFDVNLVDAVELVASVQPIPVTDEVKAQVLEFITGRLRVWLLEQAYPPDVVTAVLAEQRSNPYPALIGVQELIQWVERDNWKPILDGFARCVRITRGDKENYIIDENLFEQPEEHALYEVYQSAISDLDNRSNVDAFLHVFEPMVPAVSEYFGTGKGDGVLVNADDEAVRNNRHALLQAICAMQLGRADLSELSGF